jgi:hypothetical protein
MKSKIIEFQALSLKNNSTYSVKKVNLGASETLHSMICLKLIFDFMECCYVKAFNATHPGHAAPPEVQYAAPPWHAALPGHAAPFWACCFHWACCSPWGMLVNSQDQKTFLHYFLWCITVHSLIVLHKRLYCSIYESCYTINC